MISEYETETEQPANGEKKNEKARLDKSGFFDQDIYGAGAQSKYDHYVTSIPTDDVDVSIVNTGSTFLRHQVRH